LHSSFPNNFLNRIVKNYLIQTEVIPDIGVSLKVNDYNYISTRNTRE